MKFKLLIIVNGYPENSKSGTQIFVKSLIDELSKNGHLIHVLCSSNKNEIVHINDMTYFKVKSVSIPFISTIYFQNAAKNIWNKYLKNEKYDFVITFGVGSITPILKLAQKYNIISIYYAIDTMLDEYLGKKHLIKNNYIQHLQYKFRIRYDKKACGDANFVLCSSNSTLVSIKENYNINLEKLKVLHWGVEDSYAVGIKSNEPSFTFLLVATDHLRKGTDFFIESMKVLKEKYGISPKSIIIGDHNKDLTVKIRRYGLDINLVQKMPTHKLKDYYMRCKCLVVPSVSEGFCLPVIEAAFFGKPAIGTCVGSLPELIDDSESGYIVRSMHEFAEKMYLLAMDEKLRQNMGLNAKNNSRRYKISRVAKNLESYLVSLRKD